MLKSSKKNQRNQVRVTAGHLRGSRVQFVDGDGLRPTSDRIRETLFNWLAADIAGAHCLDLFAGSGIMSFEALSRGASAVTAIETNREAVTAIRQAQHRLTIDGLNLLNVDALKWLAGFGGQPTEQYDIVFVDPPFSADIYSRVIDLLGQSGLLAPSALVYLERPVERTKEKGLLKLPEQWLLHREKTAGGVVFQLFKAA